MLYSIKESWDLMKANLHVHSNYSDGTKTIKEIDDLAQKGCFDVVAITDHDTVNSIAELKRRVCQYVIFSESK